MAAADVNDEIDRLLATPVAAFVEERRRLSDALKAAGRRDDAKTIAKLNKPSVPVWVLNQLARTDKEVLLRLGALSDELREVPSAATAGYAQIVAEHRDVLRSLRSAAERILVQSGHDAGPGLLERVVHSLRAGMADEQTRGAIERGRLLREVGEVDFTTMVGAATAVAAADDTSKPRTRAPTAAAPTPAGGHAAVPSLPRAAEREQQRAAAAAERERTRARAAAEREVERLRAQNSSARKRVAEEERALESARRVLDAANQALAAARKTHDEKEARTEAARGEAATSAAALESAETAARKLTDP